MADLDAYLSGALVKRLEKLWITTVVDLLSVLHEDRAAMRVTLAMSDQQLDDLTFSLEQAHRNAQPVGAPAPEDRPVAEDVEDPGADAADEKLHIEFDDRARKYGAWIEKEG